MRYGAFLKKNNTIRFITPSYGTYYEPYKSREKQAIINLNKYDLLVEKSLICNDDINYQDYDFKKKALEFNNEYKNNNNHFLMSLGGGEFMTLILDDIDFNMINNSNPKWFMGYSDNTMLIFLLPTLCDIASIYGPNVCEFGSLDLEISNINTIKLIKGEKLIFNGYNYYEAESLKDEANPLVSYNLTKKKELIIYPKNDITIEGRLLGGCLDCLLNIVGTKYDKVNDFINKYSNDKIIWFLEACDLNSLGILRGLTQLKRAGWFNNVSGFIIGRSYNNNECFGLNSNNAYIEALKNLNVPIILDCDFGHLKPMIPIITGSIAKIKAKDNDFEIEYLLK